MSAVSLVTSSVSPLSSSEFSHALQRLVSPDAIARDIVADILNDDSDGQLQNVPNFTQELSTRLQQVRHFLFTFVSENSRRLVLSVCR